MMDILGVPLGAIMRLCYQLVHQYGVAIILFTVVTKVLLFPVSFWVHTNGIKMVRIQPAINRLKVKYFGDADRIADEQAELFKKEKYSPFSSLVPLAIQLILLLGLIQVINHPLSYVLNLPTDTVNALLSLAGSMDATASSSELVALSVLQNASADLPAFAEYADVMEQLRQMNMTFLGIDLAGIPSQSGGILILVPLLATAASIALSLSQNVLNPLQAEQGKVGQLMSMSLSVGLSLVLGFFVPAGVGTYWVWSNLFSILQQVVLNAVYPPRKHIDYEELEASKQELKELENIGSDASPEEKKQNAKREKADYKRFFSIVNKHLVFYSERNGYYKYFEPIIQYLLDHTNITIHYVTSDPKDQIFSLAESQPQIKPYYIGEKKLITLMMKMEADVVVMTMSDLDNYHYKRSYMKKDTEYVYVFHYPLSTHMVLHTGALDHYDTILCVGEFQFDEIRRTEEVYHLKEKKLISCGYGQLEKLYKQYHESAIEKHDVPKVLIAPSWQPDNILDSCLDDLLKQLLGKGYHVVVRPHPEYVKRYKPKMDAIVQRYATYGGGDLEFELDFTSNNSLFDSDVVISDWSGTAYEFSFVTEKPCIFIDTPPKINNPEYTKLGIEPLELSLRDKFGFRVDPKHMEGLAERLNALLQDQQQETIRALREKYIANFGHSGEIGARYLIETIQQHIQKQKENNQ